MSPAARLVVEHALEVHRDRPGALLPILHAIQDELGFVPEASVGSIADNLNLSRADVHGVVTFYHDFRESAPGRLVIKVCRAEACQAVGGESLVRDLASQLRCPMGETRQDGAVTLEPVYCLGNCALGPSALINGELRGRVHATELSEEIDRLLAGEKTTPGGAR